MDIQYGLFHKLSTRLKLTFKLLLHQLRIKTLVHTHMLVLPYKRKQGEHTLKNTKRETNKVLPEDKNRGTSLGTKFNTKDKTKKEDHPNLIYNMENCTEFYDGETCWRLTERVSKQNVKDINFHMFYYPIEANHLIVTLNNFTVLSNSNHTRTFWAPWFI